MSPKKIKKKKHNNPEPQKEEQVFAQRQPWIKYKTGIVIITITSIVMAVLTAIQAIPAKGILQGILWGLIYGGMIWAIFFGFLLFNRIFR